MSAKLGTVPFVGGPLDGWHYAASTWPRIDATVPCTDEGVYVLEGKYVPPLPAKSERSKPQAQPQTCRYLWRPHSEGTQ